MATTTAIIAALDEAGAIGEVVRGCLRHVDEVVVVDDGSTDDTADRAARAGARALRNDRNRGKGASLRRAAAQARGELLVTLDGDGQDDPGDIPRLLAALHEGADLVIGSRFAGRLEPGAITPVNRMGNLALTAALNLLYGVRLSDTQAGLRAIRHTLWRSLPLRADRYEVETEVLVRALLAGARVTEVPVTRHPRTHGRSALHGLRDGSRILACMLRLRLGG
ncbi:glycosyltransferase family 2 protein [Paraliomyxa miuraensis]|uniref:glycosyltransferase family 2 protein n=1 Tax=Paraliomyxa miuraensis TaxID=376150 RepID=UPI00225C20BE|nr:glycosyltransferase family 2 protein [Paraliomyxa miuraensis]MCX4241965.1 glycosyltransferase family 2 protein [Paraliomyxa miuraensis]